MNKESSFVHERTRAQRVVMKSSVAKHYGCTRVKQCGLIANGRSQAYGDFSCVKAGLHMRFQNAPYPTLHEWFFSRSIAWIGKKVITYYLKTPLYPISVNLAVFGRSVNTQLKSRAG